VKRSLCLAFAIAAAAHRQIVAIGSLLFALTGTRKLLIWQSATQVLLILGQLGLTTDFRLVLVVLITRQIFVQ
jgi:hypothetical protein